MKLKTRKVLIAGEEMGAPIEGEIPEIDGVRGKSTTTFMHGVPVYKSDEQTWFETAIDDHIKELTVMLWPAAKTLEKLGVDDPLKHALYWALTDRNYGAGHNGLDSCGEPRSRVIGAQKLKARTDKAEELIEEAAKYGIALTVVSLEQTLDLRMIDGRSDLEVRVYPDGFEVAEEVCYGSGTQRLTAEEAIVELMKQEA